MAAHLVRPWAWGRVDCCLTLADWAVWLGHEDPAPHLRGAYDSKESCWALVAAEGGLLRLVGDVCERAGFPALARPVRGAVGVIGAVHRSDRRWGAIHDGNRWRVRDPHGFTAMTARPLGIWSVE